MARTVFVNGSTGFVGSRLILELARRGHRVKAGVRERSIHKVPAGVEPIMLDGLRAETFQAALADCDTFVQLVGVAHPSPAKAQQFKTIDLESCRQAVNAAVTAKIEHFVYLSVAQPSPVMKAYAAARQEGERLIAGAGLNATFLRPFYVLGPGRRWPLLLRPFLWLAERIPATRHTAQRISFVTLEQMTAALVRAIEQPPQGISIWPAAEIRRSGQALRASAAA